MLDVFSRVFAPIRSDVASMPLTKTPAGVQFSATTPHLHLRPCTKAVCEKNSTSRVHGRSASLVLKRYIVRRRAHLRSMSNEKKTNRPRLVREHGSCLMPSTHMFAHHMGGQRKPTPGNTQRHHHPSSHHTTMPHTHRTPTWT